MHNAQSDVLRITIKSKHGELRSKHDELRLQLQDFNSFVWRNKIQFFGNFSFSRIILVRILTYLIVEQKSPNYLDKLLLILTLILSTSQINPKKRMQLDTSQFNRL